MPKIPTSAVLQGLRNEGFEPVAVHQTNARDVDRRAFTKHMLRFRFPGGPEGRQVGDVFPEVVLINSHDGTSSYHLTAGLFRLVCLNGMVVSDGFAETVKVPHKGDVAAQVIEGSYRVLESSQQALAVSTEWRGLTLNRDERMALAEAAHVIRFADAEGNVETPVKPEQLLDLRRHADTSTDLWTTANVIQENVIRGGLSAWGRDAHNRPHRTTTRAITGIDSDVRLNKALWTLNQRMAEMKSAA